MVNPKRRGTGLTHIDGQNLALSISLDRKYVYSKSHEPLRVLVLVISKDMKEVPVEVDGDLNVCILNNEGEELQILKKHRLKHGSAYLYNTPLVGKHIDGFNLGRHFRIQVTMEPFTMEPSLPCGLGLDADKRENRKVGALLGVPGELLRAVSEQVVNCDGKIIVTEEPTAVYYKDEGGKRNTMQMEVCILQYRNKKGEVPLPYIPLAVKLLYDLKDSLKDSLEEVKDQSILKIEPGCKMFTGLDGRLKIQFRVTEVTKRHNGKQFKMYFEHCNQQGDESVVALYPAHSSPFSVLSKRKFKAGVTYTGCDKPQLAPLYHQPEPFKKRKLPSIPTCTQLSQTSKSSPKLHYNSMLESAYSIINNLQWEIVGNLSPSEMYGKSVPLYQCPICKIKPCPYIPADNIHNETCIIGIWLNMYEQSGAGVSTGDQIQRVVNGTSTSPVNCSYQPESSKAEITSSGYDQHCNVNEKAKAASSEPCLFSALSGLPTEQEHGSKGQEPDPNLPHIEPDVGNNYSVYAFCEGL